MLELAPQRTCRLSGELLSDARVVLDLADCPLPGVYPPTAEASVVLRSPLCVVQARSSGLVQLAHRFDPSIYGEYGFAADTSEAYRRHLQWFADQVAGAWPATSAVLEVGCGDGLLLDLLGAHGFADRMGVDPGRAAGRRAAADIVGGYFPAALDAAAPGRCYDLIVVRHVLEHIETPVAFAAALAERLAPGGEVWIEVPDLDATLERELWSNLYQLHCNYFDAATLDALAGTAGMTRLRGELVDVFGGSLLHRYGRGTSGSLAQAPDRDGLAASIGAFRDRLARLAACLPEDTVGYGAAERTAMTLGAAPELARRLRSLFDGNALLWGRYLAGTVLPIAAPDAFYASPPRAVVLFAVSHRDEILRAWRSRLPAETLVAVAGEDTACTPLGQLVAP